MLIFAAGHAMSQTPANTQPTTATVSIPSKGSATAATPAASASSSTRTTATATRKANTGEIYRWVDKQGRVQYGPDVPEDRKSTARKLDTAGNIVSSRVPASIGGAPVPPVADDAAAASRQPVTAQEKCEAAWKAYNDSQACFAQYRQGTVRGAGKRSGSNTSAEALENCQSLPEPAACR